MPTINVSKLITDEELDNICQHSNHPARELKNRKTGATTGHLLTIIGEAMMNPNVPQVITPEGNERVNTDWLLDALNSILVKFDLKHLVITKDTKHQCYTLTYDIYKHVDIQRQPHHIAPSRNWSNK